MKRFLTLKNGSSQPKSDVSMTDFAHLHQNLSNICKNSRQSQKTQGFYKKKTSRYRRIFHIWSSKKLDKKPGLNIIILFTVAYFHAVAAQEVTGSRLEIQSVPQTWSPNTMCSLTIWQATGLQLSFCQAPTIAWKMSNPISGKWFGD